MAVHTDPNQHGAHTHENQPDYVAHDWRQRSVASAISRRAENWRRNSARSAYATAPATTPAVNLDSIAESLETGQENGWGDQQCCQPPDKERNDDVLIHAVSTPVSIAEYVAKHGVGAELRQHQQNEIDGGGVP
ncbi:hypothetical protein ABT168_21725 [Streptomyces sp. NPDC001793]|uniref:hypothetical protein n=1 Tax=Streptomyces sp. NPDC001793 TaxID=3154657 RepID=UPI003333F856